MHLSHTGLAEQGRDLINLTVNKLTANNGCNVWVWVPGESVLYEKEVSCERFTCAICYWVPKYVYRHRQMCLKPLRKKVYSVAFEHQKTGDRVCLNESNYVAVNATKIQIAPIVVERVGLSEYVFFNLKPPFPTNFLKSRVRQKIHQVLFTWNRVKILIRKTVHVNEIS